MKSNIPTEVPNYLEQFIYQNEWDASPEWLKEAVLVGGNKNDIYILMKDGGKMCLFEETLGAYKKCKGTDNPEESEKLLHEFIISGPLNLLKSFNITIENLWISSYMYPDAIKYFVDQIAQEKLTIHNLFYSNYNISFEVLCSYDIATLEKLNKALNTDTIDDGVLKIVGEIIAQSEQKQAEEIQKQKTINGQSCGFADAAESQTTETVETVIDPITESNTPTVGSSSTTTNHEVSAIGDVEKGEYQSNTPNEDAFNMWG